MKRNMRVLLEAKASTRAQLMEKISKKREYHRRWHEGVNKGASPAKSLVPKGLKIT